MGGVRNGGARTFGDRGRDRLLRNRTKAEGVEHYGHGQARQLRHEDGHNLRLQEHVGLPREQPRWRGQNAEAF